MVDILSDLKLFTRKVNLKIMFKNDEGVKFKRQNNFYRKSTFNPSLNLQVKVFENIYKKEIRRACIKIRHQEGRDGDCDELNTIGSLTGNT